MPAQYSKLRFWRNTAVATLAPGQTLTLAPGTGTLGYEWDVDADNGFRPAGEFDLSSTTRQRRQPFTADYGTHEVTAQHRDPSPDALPGAERRARVRRRHGPVVVGPGQHQRLGAAPTDAPDPTMQQATVNLLADMGAQPATLQSGLVAASKLSGHDAADLDHHAARPRAPPSATGASVDRSPGTATDTGGGVVAGVEVSTDGGTTWHPATTDPGSRHERDLVVQLDRARQPDDDDRSRAPSTTAATSRRRRRGVTVNVSCPCSIWGTARDAVAHRLRRPTRRHARRQVHVRHVGTIPGVRFYKSAANTGHPRRQPVDRLDGTLLAQATFTSESASGWQSGDFSNPVTISAGTTYVASLLRPERALLRRPTVLLSAAIAAPADRRRHVDSRHVARVAANTGSTTNGVFTYGASSTFPTEQTPTRPTTGSIRSSPRHRRRRRQVTGVSATAGRQRDGHLDRADERRRADQYSHAVHRLDSPDADDRDGRRRRRARRSPGLTAGTTYTFTVQASNAAGTGPASAPSNSVTPTGPTAPSAPTGVSAIRRPARRW